MMKRPRISAEEAQIWALVVVCCVVGSTLVVAVVQAVEWACVNQNC
jgi:hypothetical protein